MTQQEKYTTTNMHMIKDKIFNIFMKVSQATS